MSKKYSDEILKKACSQYKIKLEEAQLIRSNKNFIYDCGDKFLRISPSNIRSKSEIEAEISWLIYLKENQIAVVELIQSNSKNYFEIIDYQDNYSTAVCFKRIIGDKISKPHWNDKHFQRLGKLTGLLHRVGKKYVPKDNLKYEEWDTIHEFESYKYLPQDKRELPELHHKIVNQINQYPKSKENYGLIHYDIHHGNYMLNRQNSELILLDFEVSCKSWFINDISTVLYYANHFPKKIGNEEFESHFMSQFWKGYEQEHEIREEEKEWMPKFLLYRDLMVYGFISNIWKKKELNKTQIKYFDMIEKSINNRRNKQGI